MKQIWVFMTISCMVSALAVDETSVQPISTQQLLSQETTTALSETEPPFNLLNDTEILGIGQDIVKLLGSLDGVEKVVILDKLSTLCIVVMSSLVMFALNLLVYFLVPFIPCLKKAQFNRYWREARGLVNVNPGV